MKSKRRKSDSRQEPEVVADAEGGPSMRPSKSPLAKYAKQREGSLTLILILTLIGGKV